MLPCSVLGGRIPALCSIRGSWWKPYLQGSVCVPPPEEQQPAYTGITHWNELSFWQKRNRIPGTQSNSSLFFFLLSTTCQNLRKPVSCLLGFHTFVLPLSDVGLPLKYLAAICPDGSHFQKLGRSAKTCKLARVVHDECLSKSWQLRTCCQDTQTLLGRSNVFFYTSEVIHRDKPQTCFCKE